MYDKLNHEFKFALRTIKGGNKDNEKTSNRAPACRAADQLAHSTGIGRRNKLALASRILHIYHTRQRLQRIGTQWYRYSGRIRCRDPRQ